MIRRYITLNVSILLTFMDHPVKYWMREINILNMIWTGSISRRTGGLVSRLTNKTAGGEFANINPIILKQGKIALTWTRPSCHDFRANEVRLQLFALAYNLGNFLRILGLPHKVEHWTLTA